MNMKFDISRHLGAVTRVVTHRERDGKPAKVVVATRTYDAEIADVWDALTSAERIPRWFMPITGELRLGGRFQLTGNAGGEILRCEPPRALTVTWEYGGEVSWVEVRLVADGAATRLELEHTAHVPPEFWDQYGPGAVGVGWELGLMGLAEHLADRTADLPPESTAWPTTPAGKEFTRRSSEGWGAASVAAGTDAAAAAAAVARTTAFYTGDPGIIADQPRA
jgi:uncharacterized protein YndB with AHSA1/START domain